LIDCQKTEQKHLVREIDRPVELAFGSSSMHPNEAGDFDLPKLLIDALPSRLLDELGLTGFKEPLDWRPLSSIPVPRFFAHARGDFDRSSVTA
jgi:hypothetical protein